MIPALIANVLIVLPLALVAWAADRLGAKPNVRHALWLIVLLKFVTPPVMQVPVPSIGRPAAAPIVPDSSTFALKADPAPVDAMQPDTAVNDPIAAAPAAESAATYVSPFAAVAALWILGSCAWIVVSLRRIAAFHRCLRETTPASPELAAEAARVAAAVGLRRAPRVSVTAARVSPLMWPTWRGAQVVLPKPLIDSLDGDARAALLAHEFAHVRRGDGWVRVLEFAVLSLFWWHPAAWLAAARLRAAEEECCDLIVVASLPGSSKAYGRALLDALDFLSEPPRPLRPILASPFGVQAYERRLRCILDSGARAGFTSVERWLLVGVAAVVLFASPAQSTATQAVPSSMSVEQIDETSVDPPKTPKELPHPVDAPTSVALDRPKSDVSPRMRIGGSPAKLRGLWRVKALEVPGGLDAGTAASVRNGLFTVRIEKAEIVVSETFHRWLCSDGFSPSIIQDLSDLGPTVGFAGRLKGSPCMIWAQLAPLAASAATADPRREAVGRLEQQLSKADAESQRLAAELKRIEALKESTLRELNALKEKPRQ